MWFLKKPKFSLHFSVALRKCHGQGNLIKEVSFGLWFLKARVHHGGEEWRQGSRHSNKSLALREQEVRQDQKHSTPVTWRHSSNKAPPVKGFQPPQTAQLGSLTELPVFKYLSLRANTYLNHYIVGPGKLMGHLWVNKKTILRWLVKTITQHSPLNSAQMHKCTQTHTSYIQKHLNNFDVLDLFSLD
jgi:hypothetical protein